MKPKEYVKKYNLLSGKKFNHSNFIGDLTLDFMSLMELGRKNDGTYTIEEMAEFCLWGSRLN